MATKKTTGKSGFNGPTIGRAVPKGTTFKKGANGRYTMVAPKKSGSKKK